jgi:hypothetical protein
VLSTGPQDISGLKSFKAGLSVPRNTALLLRDDLGAHGTQVYCGVDNYAHVYVQSGVDFAFRSDASLQLPSSGKLLAPGGLGVGNSAPASLPATVVKKIEVFDATGASLGYLAVYDAIG